MEGKKILELVGHLEKDREEKENNRREKVRVKKDTVARFYRCQKNASVVKVNAKHQG